jgi:hypothetical protein
MSEKSDRSLSRVVRNSAPILLSRVSLRPSRRASSAGLLQLRINRSADPVPLPNPSGTEVWLDAQGRQVGYGHAGEGWLHLVGVATFTFGPSGVEAVAREDVATEKIRDAHRRLVLPLALQALGQEVLHASAVAVEAGAVAFCAESGTGKSTVAYALARRGHPPCADDAVAIGPGRRGPELIPLPFALRLRPASAAYFGEDAQPLEVQHPVERRPLAAICVLQRLEQRLEEGTGIRRLGRAEAFPALLAHAYSFGLNDERRRRRMMEHYLSLASEVPVFRVDLASGVSTLARTLDEIEAAVA